MGTAPIPSRSWPSSSRGYAICWAGLSCCLQLWSMGLFSDWQTSVMLRAVRKHGNMLKWGKMPPTQHTVRSTLLIFVCFLSQLLWLVYLYGSLRKCGKAISNEARQASIAPPPMNRGRWTRLPKKLTKMMRTVFPTCTWNQQRNGKDYKGQTLGILMTPPADLIKSSQHAGLLTGEAVASLDGGDGALHIARHQKLWQLQQTVTQHKELQRRRSEGSERWMLPWQPV